MKAIVRYFNVFLILVSVFTLCAPQSALAIKREELATSEANQTASALEYDPEWAWPMPEKPIPHHDVGHVSPALDYTTDVDVINPETRMVETVQLSGVDALAADGSDPFAGNYNMVSLDKIFRSASVPGTGPYYNFAFESFEINTNPAAIAAIPGSYDDYGKYPHDDIAAGDLNNDGQAEQILAWLDGEPSLNLYTTEMPGYIGRTTSAPGLVTANSIVHLLVRGYDHTLWHLEDVDNPALAWDKDGGGGMLLSAPAIVSTGPNAFDVYSILANNLVYRRSWSDGDWSGGGWELVDDPAYWQPLENLVPVPELAAPAVVAREGMIDLFRLAPDNTLRWRHFNGSTWEAWHNLGGMLASGPAAISMGTDHIQVFASGADNALWTRIFNAGWESWQRLDLGGMPLDVHIASAPAVISLPAMQNFLYVRGSDNQLWKMTYFDESYDDWIDQDGILASAPGASLMEGHLPYIAAQTETGGLQISRASTGWENLADGLPSIPTNVDTGFLGETRNQGAYWDLSLDVETGYFWGDGRSQTVAAYASAGNQVTFSLFDTSSNPDQVGFTQNLITSYVTPTSDEVSFFRIAAGDFLNRDGVDEIALLRINGAETEYAVDILSFNRDPDSPAFTKETSITTLTTLSGFTFTGTLEIAPGDYDGDGLEELAVISSWTKYDGEWEGLCDGNRFLFMTRVYDIDFDPLTDEPEINAYNVENFWHDTASLDASVNSVGLTITSGDVDNDGMDEIVRTWPHSFADSSYWCYALFTVAKNDSEKFIRKVQVIDLAHNEDWRSNSWDIDPVDGQIDTGKFTITDASDGTVSANANSFRDRVVIGDFDRDMMGEFLLQAGTNSGQEFKVFKLDTETDDYERILNQFEGEIRYYPRLVSDDFTGEGLRVGTPSYRVQEKMITPVVFLNRPPIHRDILENSDDPILFEVGAGAYATHVYESTTEDSSMVESKRDWSLSTSLETSASAMGHTVSTSLSNTYGESFSKAAQEINAYTLTEENSAEIDDQVIYNSTKYGVWEYPVYGAEGEMPEDPYTIVVAFPLNISQTNSPETKNGSHCDESFYAPSHQVNNVWSYDDAMTGSLVPDDYNPDRLFLFDKSTTGSTDLTLIMQNSITKEYSSSFSNQVSAGVEYSYENELSIPLVGKVFDFSFRASVEGTYGIEGLSTMSSAFSKLTSVMVHIPPPEVIGNAYTTRSLLYWAQAGYLVMDYQTQPTEGGYWMAYEKPDPAFTLPWYGFPDHETGIFPSTGELDGPPCGLAKQLFSHDIKLDPGYVQYGDMLIMTATVRNFSYETSTSPVSVHFFLGIPAAENEIGNCTTTTALDRQNGPEQCSTSWVVDRGSGEEKIYAVIDYTDALDEMHDEKTMINNNIGYGLIYIANADYLDPGLRLKQAYYDIQYEEAPGLGYGLYLPTNNSNESIRYELISTDISGAGVVGTPLEIVAYRGGLELPDHVIGSIPAALIAKYRDEDLSGAENDLQLYRYDDPGWVEASCPGYEPIHFLADNMLAVPICQTGTYLLSTENPGGVVVNEAPSFTSVPITSAVVDELYTYNIAAADTDEDELTIIVTKPTWLTFVDNGDGTAVLTGTPSMAELGDHFVELTVTDDGGLFDTQSFSITVSEHVEFDNMIYLPQILK